MSATYEANAWDLFLWFTFTKNETDFVTFLHKRHRNFWEFGQMSTKFLIKET